MVYFLGVGNPYIAIKIGVAAQTGTRDLKGTVKRRLDQIQSSNHEPIELIGVVYFEKGAHEYPMWHADALERELHNQFQHILLALLETLGVPSGLHIQMSSYRT